MEWAGMGEMRDAYRIFVGKPRRKRPLGRSRDIGEDDIEIDLKEIGRENVGWIRLAQDRHQRWAFVNKVTNL
jgi:hypothetical protein